VLSEIEIIIRDILSQIISRLLKNKLSAGEYQINWNAKQTPRAITAFNNLKAIGEAQLKGKYWIEVIDLLKTPQLGRDHQILAIPTLVRKFPVPVRRIISDLSNTEGVRVGLDLKEQFELKNKSKS